MSESNGITVSNQCFQCHSLNELCPDCQDERDTRDTVIAHELVDDSSDIYRYAPMYTSLTKIEPEVSGHEWVGSSIRIGKRVRDEFLEPTTLISDRIFEPNLELADDERVCVWCHLVTLSQTKCVNCDEVVQ